MTERNATIAGIDLPASGSRAAARSVPCLLRLGKEASDIA
jgi:hypothetical protein